MKKGIGPNALGSPAKLNGEKKKKDNVPLGPRQQMQQKVFEEKQKRARERISPERRKAIESRFENQNRRKEIALKRKK